MSKGITLKNIDLTGISPSTEREKISEEDREFENAIYESLVNRSYDNDKHAIEEFWDTVQARLGLLQLTLGITADEVMEHYYLHEEKLLNRPRDKKVNDCE